MDVRVLDGCSIGRVTHYTTPITLRVSGNHSETIQFLLVKTPQIPVVWDSPGFSDTITSSTGLRVPSWAGVSSATPIAWSQCNLPGTYSWWLESCPGPLRHPRGVPWLSGRFSERPGPLCFRRTGPMTAGLTFSKLRLVFFNHCLSLTVLGPTKSTPHRHATARGRTKGKMGKGLLQWHITATPEIMSHDCSKIPQ